MSFSPSCDNETTRMSGTEIIAVKMEMEIILNTEVLAKLRERKAS